MTEIVRGDISTLGEGNKLFYIERGYIMKHNIWKKISIISMLALLFIASSFATGTFSLKGMIDGKKSETNPEVVASSVSGEEALIDWTDGGIAKQELIDYVDTVTNPMSVDYIPVDDRIAVFDMDGTIVCETDPVYFDFCLLKYRVLDDPTYKDKASDFERNVAIQIQRKFNGEDVDISMVDHGKAVASAFSGMTVDEMEDYVKAFKNQPEPGYTGMTRGEAFYQPMLEVINYLEANEFTVYVVSGTDRLITRGLCDGMLDLPPSQMIGSDETLVADHQDGEDGLDYEYEDDDELVLGGEFMVKNLNMNKVSVIAQEIGKQPVLAFGNSASDSSMLEYTTRDNRFKSLAFMICCDDTVRENGNLEKAQKMVDLCNEKDWIPVSMKNDWTTIYGDGVSRKVEK